MLDELWREWEYCYKMSALMSEHHLVDEAIAWFFQAQTTKDIIESL